MVRGIIGKYSLRKPSGHFFISDPEGGSEGDTFSCKHCGLIQHVNPQSGKERGYCAMCHGPTCGRLKCQSCEPLMKKIEAMEARGRLNAAMNT